jgi:hypothetical protein
MFGVDHDSKSELLLLKTYLNASSFGNTAVCETQHGYHFRVYLECPRETAMELRKLLGDDNRRMAFEEKEIHDGITDWDDTLFQGKFGNDGEWYYEEPIENVLVLPFLSRIKPLKKEMRPKGHAQGSHLKGCPQGARKYIKSKKRRCV